MKSIGLSMSVASLLVVVAAAGCAGGAAGEGEGEGEGASATPADIKTALDGILDRCGAQFFGFTAQEEPTLTGILASQVKAEIEASLDQEASDANVAYDPALGAKCVSEINALSCDAFGAGANAAPDCEAAFTGKLQDGATCASSNECVHGSSCFGLDASHGTCGTCAADVTTAGGDCTHANCGDGFSCDNNGKCQPVTQTTLHAGDPCPDFQCGSDLTLTCDQTQHCVAITVVQLGAACDNAAQHCIDGATKNFCDPTTNKCTARPGLDGDCSTIPLCDATVATCDSTSHTCVAAKAHGDACAQNDVCVSGQQCTGGICSDELTIDPLPTCH